MWGAGLLHAVLTRGKLFVLRSRSNAGTRALVPNVWTRKGPTEAGPKFASSRKMVFRSGTIPSAGIGSRKKSPAEAGQGLILEENQDEDPVSNHANRGCFGASTAKRLIREANFTLARSAARRCLTARLSILLRRQRWRFRLGRSCCPASYCCCLVFPRREFAVAGRRPSRLSLAVAAGFIARCDLYQFPLIRTRAPIGAVRWT